MHAAARTTQLPVSGYLRQADLIGNPRKGRPALIPFSAATLWRKVQNGTFPAPVKLSERVTAWRVTDVQSFLHDCEAATDAYKAAA